MILALADLSPDVGAAALREVILSEDHRVVFRQCVCFSSKYPRYLTEEGLRDIKSVLALKPMAGRPLPHNPGFRALKWKEKFSCDVEYLPITKRKPTTIFLYDIYARGYKRTALKAAGRIGAGVALKEILDILLQYKPGPVL